MELSDDFITTFVAATEFAISPLLFRKWSAISLVAGAIERRVWAKVGDKQTFGNLYTMLVAPPGVGKQVIEFVEELWTEAINPVSGAAAFHVSPTNMTKASLIDELEQSKQLFTPKSGPPLEYHSLLIAAEEGGALLPGYDTEYLGVLEKIYNNPRIPYRETRRHGPKKDTIIPFPQLNILIGLQPGRLAETFPEVAWSTGFFARIIMVYAADTPFMDVFAADPNLDLYTKRLLTDLGRFSCLHGEMDWTPAAVAKIREWRAGGEAPVPTHSKLENYNRRRTLHLLKLSLISAVSRQAQIIDLRDVLRAQSWLFEVEALMPDIFRAMVGKSDSQVIEELHLFVLSVWRMNGHKPIGEDQITRFLSARVPVEKTTKLLEVAERGNFLARIAGTTTYLPKPRQLGAGTE